MAKPQLKVFLCHTSQDKPTVRVLNKYLIERDVKTWFDENQLLPGQNFKREISKAVKNTDVVIVCLSQKSITKEGFVQREINEALDIAEEKLDESIFIIPARLDGCDVPDRLNMYQWVDLFAKDGYERLLRALIARAKQIGARPPSNPNLEKPFILFLKRLNLFFRYITDLIIRLFKKYWGWILFVILIFFVSILIKRNFQNIFAFVNPSPTPTPTFTFTPTTLPTKPNFLNPTSLPTNTPTLTPTLTLTPTNTSTSTPLPESMKDNKGVEMMFIPAGKFIMGLNADRGGTVEEDPNQEVKVEAFYIDKYEVTNRLYIDCVKAGPCNPPHKVNSDTRPDYYGNPQFDNYPVINVDWHMAVTYCSWRDARLPTEAEWEKAARGTNERIYPWKGNEANCNYANFYNCKEDTTEVGVYQWGKSPYDVYDMAGNVREWVSTLYVVYLHPYSDEGRENLDAKGNRVFRGGAWSSPSVEQIRTSYRSGADPSTYFLSLGFRCAKSAIP